MNRHFSHRKERERLVFVHVPKCGGMSVHAILEALGLDEWTRQTTGAERHSPKGHIEASLLPWRVIEEHLTFTTLRDPWSWYLSYLNYHSFADGSLRPSMAPFCTTGDSVDDIVRSMASPSEQGVPPRWPIGTLMFDGKTVTATELEEHGVGLYSWYLATIIGTGRVESGITPISPIVRIAIDTARLNEGLTKLFEAAHIETDTGVALSYGKVNASGDNPARGRWSGTVKGLLSDETIEMIRHRDRHAIELMGWPGPDEPAPESMVWFPEASR